MAYYQFKVKTGYREDQFQIIDSEEIHKAYYLFLNPEARAIFNNGVALIGKTIQSIDPDYNTALGFNEGYKLVAEDHKLINKQGIGRTFQKLSEKAQDIAKLALENKEIVNLPLSTVLENKELKYLSK